MSERFFVGEAVTGGRAVLRGAEARHLARVMRLGQGSEVVLFDGSGAEFAARVVEVRRGEVLLDVLAPEELRRELAVELILAAAVPKGERLRWMLEKATELGVAALVPIITRRGVAQPRAAGWERLRRVVIEASKQCGRNRLMQIMPPAPWPQVVESFPEAAVRALGDAGGVPFRRWAEEAFGRGAGERSVAGLDRGNAEASGARRQVVLAVGPEGGFTPEELALATDAGWTAVSLGPRTLRIETAAIAWCAAVALLAES